MRQQGRPPALPSSGSGVKAPPGSDALQPTVEAVARLELRPGDILVARGTRPLSTDEVTRIKSYLSALLGAAGRADVPVAVIDPGLSLEVVKCEPSKPMVGLPVLVRTECMISGQYEHAAMITGVMPDGRINVFLMPDSELPYPVSDVVHVDSENPSGMLTWRWPPRS
jgi:hypothetical protein